MLWSPSTTMNEADIERVVQLLRAFVRPHHGEIQVLKHDGHPTHGAHKFVKFLSSASIHDETSPPYVHEGVGECEVTWQWDAPAANALLLASKSLEGPNRHD